ncbi:tetratricopeptide repeat protein [candidate division KSB1 bacterium]
MHLDEQLQKLQHEAEEHLRNGNLDKAGEVLLQILETGPPFPYGLYQLGLYHFNKGDNDQAVKKLNAALKMAPEMLSARFLLGRALLEQRLFKESLQQFRECVKLDNRDDEAYFFMAKASFELKQPDDALAFLIEANAIEPDNILYKEAIAAFYVQKEEHNKAEEYLSLNDMELIDRQETLLLLSDIAEKLGKREEQLTILEKLISINPKSKDLIGEKIRKLKENPE